ncbi:DUF2806 domain-containing protein [Arachidicoccus soli]|uniref:DUF2806 domain-containing protein n=1 Tax=Arachidicoccus soli TaxID=2341117 RepID=A0A386HNK0_9BACT|nr:DUF2806 domain-containing protein [Arachidicoccus soli]AYD47395.1 DUF2806 domain-containing protein [Arachidicoccus soli]
MTENSGLDKVTDTVSILLDKVPAPIKRNFLKALGQLSTAVIDIPAAWLESKSAEIRATSQARIQIIKSEGNKFSEQIDIPQPYIDKASEKYASKIIKEQINLDDISQKASKELASDDYSKQENSEKEISDDWLNEFENNARQMSSEEMRFIFSKILANEVKNPGNFSIRTIRLISQLDNIAAIHFQKLCSCAISMEVNNDIIDTRVVSLAGNAASNSLTKYGLSFDNLNVLQEYGLIISEFNSYMDYTPSVVTEQNTVALAFKFSNEHFAFLPTDREKYEKNMRLYGVMFSKSGKELYKIIPTEKNITYKKDFEEFLERRFLKLIPVKTN